MVGLGIVGFGYWGPNLVRNFNSISGSGVTYCSDLDDKRLAHAKSVYPKISITKDYREILNNKKIDAVIIATPPTTHYEIAKELISLGYPLLVEKPLVLKLDQALELKKLADEKNVNVLVGYIYLYHPAILKVKSLLKKISPIKEIIFSGLQSPIRSDVSVLWDWGPHFVSIAHLLLNQIPSKVKGYGTNEDVVVEMNYVKTKVIMYMKWQNTNKVRKIEIRGDKGKIIFDDLVPKKITLKLKDTVTFPDFKESSPLLEEVKYFISLLNVNKKSRLDDDIKITRILTQAQDSMENPVRSS